MNRSTICYPFIVGVFVSLFAGACASTPVSPEPVTELKRESTHFVFLSNTKHATLLEMEQGLVRAETLFQKISTLVGPALTPQKKIRVLLEGDFQDQGPYFDLEGIHLFRYSAEENGYWALIAHEMAHAFREAWYISHETSNWPTYAFLDEGFAEFVAQNVDPTKTGFPFYGFPEDVVAGYWVTHDQHIPPAVLRERHQALNQPCEIQAYPERASWIRYVDETYGRERLLDLVYHSEEPTSAFVQRILGVSLEQLDADWQAWIAARYAATPNAEATAQAYRERTSWAHICTAGVEF